MRNRVQGESSHATGGGVSQFEGRVAVPELVKNYGKDQDDKSNDLTSLMRVIMDCIDVEQGLLIP